MTFKENVLKKMKIDGLYQKVQNTIGSLESNLKIDKDAMRKLFAMSSFKQIKERDLELYVHSGTGNINRVIVLDNDLPLYETTVADVVLRKSPTVKEMVKVRNIIKILNDGDVVKSKKKDTLKMLHQELISSLDLVYRESDLDGILEEISIGIKIAAFDDALEGLTILMEILGIDEAPAGFLRQGCSIWGTKTLKAGKEFQFGPMVVFNAENGLLLVHEETVSSQDTELSTKLDLITGGRHRASLKGMDALAFLKHQAMTGPCRTPYRRDK